MRLTNFDGRISMSFFLWIGKFRIYSRNTHEGNKVLAFFDVMSWGYGAYVYLQVVSPSGHELQKFDAESEGRIDFTATEDGEHSFCFRNAQTETEVSFWVNTESDSALTDVAKEGMFLI